MAAIDVAEDAHRLRLLPGARELLVVVGVERHSIAA
jgi:hypothetical protein